MVVVGRYVTTLTKLVMIVTLTSLVYLKMHNSAGKATHPLALSPMQKSFSGAVVTPTGLSPQSEG